MAPAPVGKETSLSTEPTNPRTSLLAAPTSVAVARCFTRDAISPWEGSRYFAADLVDVAMLLVSELVTNAIVHAESEVDLVIHLRDEGLRVEVHDADGEHFPVLWDERGFDEQGRGIVLVAALATRWGAEPDGSGKLVWFEIDALAGGV